MISPLTPKRPIHFTFLEAVGDGNTDRVKSMLEENGKLLFSQECSYSRPPKHSCLMGSDRNALHFALDNDDNTMLKLLLSYKGIEALVNKEDGTFSLTPLHYIARKRENPVESTELLLNAGANPFSKELPNNKTPFYEFVDSLQLENVILIINHVKSKTLPKLKEVLSPFLHCDLIPIVHAYYTSDLMDAINENIKYRPTILSLITFKLYRHSVEKKQDKKGLKNLEKTKKIFRLLMNNGGDLNAPILYNWLLGWRPEQTPLAQLRKAIANQPKYAEEFQDELRIANAEEQSSEVAFQNKKRKLF